MVKLTSPLIHGGRIVPAGITICLDTEFEETLIRNNHAVLVEQLEPETEPEIEPEIEPETEPAPVIKPEATPGARRKK